MSGGIATGTETGIVTAVIGTVASKLTALAKVNALVSGRGSGNESGREVAMFTVIPGSTLRTVGTETAADITAAAITTAKCRGVIVTD